MNKCEYFKDLILTDYIDERLDKNLAGALESHLLDCPDCHSFLKEVQNNAALPFQQSSQQAVPAELWDAIKQGIEQDTQTPCPLAGLAEALKGLFALPRLIPVFSSLILMLLAGSATLNTINIQQAKDRDQGEYLVSLLSPADATALSDNNNGGTAIEHYFL